MMACRRSRSIDRDYAVRCGCLDGRKADAVVVVKLDRLTRAVKDLGVLCERYFGEGTVVSACGERLD